MRALRALMHAARALRENGDDMHTLHLHTFIHIIMQTYIYVHTHTQCHTHIHTSVADPMPFKLILRGGGGATGTP